MLQESAIGWLYGLVGKAAPDEGWADDEHIRYGLYQECLAGCSEDTEEAIVGIVVQDPDRTMAEATLVRHVDRLAPAYGSAEAFAARVRVIAVLASGFDFLQTRIEHWQLVKRAETDPEGSLAGILAGTHWLQRTIVETSDSPLLLTALAEHGGSRRVRNTAADRLRRASSGVRRNPG
ncbi:hypothetical protein BX265_5503 [Streptomyces sp. TLI_235]|nr:hypothetical protein [Streptomyces sp. TLI_235]PBC70943.1 hypothetical protein BX265_5503 [Streptomyces sp. TLI_235]